MADRGTRSWSLATARAVISEVRRLTAAAVEAVDVLEARRGEVAGSGNPAALAALEQELSRAVSAWVRSMEALGVEVKGRWLIDFDNGRGYYCWRWPEEQLDYYHGYEDGFAGRVRIQ
jgi:hypothetical protein